MSESEMLRQLKELREENETLKEQNKAYVEELTRMNSLISNLPCTVSWISKDLDYLSINKELQELLNVDFKEFEKKKVGFIKSVGNPFYEFVTNFFEQDLNFDEVEYSTDISGDTRHFLVMAQKVKENEQAVVIGFDITEKVNMREKIQNDERLRTIAELSTGIVHEIKNPLSVIKGSADIILAKEDLDLDIIFDLASRIDKMSERILKIIDGLKNIARDNSGDEKELTILKDIIEESVLICKSKVYKHGVDFNILNETAENLKVHCIEGQIIQILVNLIGNACEAVSDLESKWVNLEIKETDTNITLSVIDSGSGIPAEILKRMFEPFYTTKTKEIGTGMGLGICRDLAKEHGGELVYNEVNGHTSFSLTLPKKQLAL